MESNDIDLDVLRGPRPQRRNEPLVVRLERLDDETRGLVLEWLDDYTVTPRDAAHKLSAAGFDVSDSVIARRRRRQAEVVA